MMGDLIGDSEDHYDGKRGRMVKDADPEDRAIVAHLAVTTEREDIDFVREPTAER
jgi:hypothetical protein